MKKILLTLGLATLLTGLLSACAGTTDPSEAYKDETPQQIYNTGREALKDKSYSEAIKRFEALDVQYPYGRDTENAQLYLAYAYYMKDDYALASAQADRFIRIHPVNPHIDYAYYIRGLSDYYQNMGVLERFFSIDLAKRDLTQVKKAYSDFNQLVINYPDSKYTPAAYQYMVYLRNIIANHELEVAQYYYDRKAYVAAANRASGVVAHYQGAPAVVDALKLMIKSYRTLGLRRQENETQKVLMYNFPNMRA